LPLARQVRPVGHASARPTTRGWVQICLSAVPWQMPLRQNCG
jgi:hypothetical protein